MHLSPIKGGFPYKDQHDRTAPIDASATGIERGSIIRLNDNGNWVLAADGTAPLFIALQSDKDLQAKMAGLYTVGQGPADPYHYPDAANLPTAAISGISMDGGDVWEIDMFDDEALKDAPVNTKLTVAEGRITLAEGEDPVVGYLVKGPYTRYCNDAVAVEGMMTGANVDVIQFQCA